MNKQHTINVQLIKKEAISSELIINFLFEN